MSDLREKKNDSAEKKPPPLDQKTVKERLKYLEGWEISSDGKKIMRNFLFKNFREAINFIIGAADFAEKIGHYPDIMAIRLRKVTVELTTRSMDGLSEKDFILAEELDLIAGWKNRLEQWLVSSKVLVALIIIVFLVILWRLFG